MRDDARKTGSSPVQHRLLQGQTEQGVSAGRAVPEPLDMAGVSRAGGSEGHHPQGPSWGMTGARLPTTGPGLQVISSSVVCTLTLLLSHSNI